MKLLTVSSAKVSWVFDISLMNPQGISFQEVFSKLTERYRFSKPAKHPLDLNEARALAFQFGTFLNSKKLPIGVDLTIYNDGAVADTLSSTDDCEEFLQDALSWLTKSFGFVIPEPSKMKRGYFSQVEVESTLSLEGLNPKLTSFVRTLETLVKPLDGKARHFEMAGIGCWAEDLLASGAPAAFRFERKWGVAFSSNRYLSTAPLQTKEHLELLEEFERIFISPESPAARP